MDINISDILEPKWSKEPLSINEFINHYKLPQIVKIHDGESKRIQMPGNFNLEQPILLYKVYTCRKIHGRSLAMDEKGRIRPTGPALIIPESYPGNYFNFSENFNKMKAVVFSRICFLNLEYTTRMYVI